MCIELRLGYNRMLLNSTLQRSSGLANHQLACLTCVIVVFRSSILVHRIFGLTVGECNGLAEIASKSNVLLGWMMFVSNVLLL